MSHGPRIILHDIRSTRGYAFWSSTGEMVRWLKKSSNEIITAWFTGTSICIWFWDGSKFEIYFGGIGMDQNRNDTHIRHVITSSKFLTGPKKEPPRIETFCEKSNIEILSRRRIVRVYRPCYWWDTIQRVNLIRTLVFVELTFVLFHWQYYCFLPIEFRAIRANSHNLHWWEPIVH